MRWSSALSNRSFLLVGVSSAVVWLILIWVYRSVHLAVQLCLRVPFYRLFRIAPPASWLCYLLSWNALLFEWSTSFSRQIRKGDCEVNIQNVCFQFTSVAQSCPTLCDPTDCSMPGLPVHHQLPELAKTHVHWAGDAIQPSHPLCSLLLLSSIFPSIRVFSSELALCIRYTQKLIPMVQRFKC